MHHEHTIHRRGQHRLAPEYREFPNGNDDPRRLLRLNVYFDNPVPTKGGEFEDRGGFWAPVELWHHDADRWQQLYQKGMRVLVVGRMERDPDGQRRSATRDLAGQRAQCRHPAVPHRVRGPQSEATGGRAEAPGHPGTGYTEGNEAQEVTRHGGRLPQCFAALHALRTIPRG